MLEFFRTNTDDMGWTIPPKIAVLSCRDVLLKFKLSQVELIDAETFFGWSGTVQLAILPPVWLQLRLLLGLTMRGPEILLPRL